MMGNYKPNEFAKKIGVSVITLQRWDNKGILVANRTPTNRRYYTDEQLEQYKNQNKQKKYIIELCEKCGQDYVLTNIDFEQCIYKDFGNGYDVEISSASKRGKLASIYVWYKDTDKERYQVVESLHDIPHHTLPTILKEIERRYINA